MRDRRDGYIQCFHSLSYWCIRQVRDHLVGWVESLLREVEFRLKSRHQVASPVGVPRSRDTARRQMRSAVNSAAATRFSTPPLSSMITHSVVSGSKLTHTDSPTCPRPTQWQRSYTETLPAGPGSKVTVFG